jgi:hypothetical protein
MSGRSRPARGMVGRITPAGSGEFVEHPTSDIEDLIVAGTAPSQALAAHLAACAQCEEYAREMDETFHLVAYMAPVKGVAPDQLGSGPVSKADSRHP